MTKIKEFKRVVRKLYIMAAIYTTNLTLSKESGAYIDCCAEIGAYIVIVKAELQDGAHAIFEIASSFDGQKRVKRNVSVAGSNGEQVLIVWPSDSKPILTFETDENAPDEKLHYNLKII